VIVLGVPLYFLIRWLVRRGKRKQAQKNMPPMPPSQ